MLGNGSTCTPSGPSWSEPGLGRAVGREGHHLQLYAPGPTCTPGVEQAFPALWRLVGPLLRTLVQGADTAVWLAVSDAAKGVSGGFWFDRAEPEHVPCTWVSRDEAERLWGRRAPSYRREGRGGMRRGGTGRAVGPVTDLLAEAVAEGADVKAGACRGLGRVGPPALDGGRHGPGQRAEFAFFRNQGLSPQYAAAPSRCAPAGCCSPALPGGMGRRASTRRCSRYVSWRAPRQRWRRWHVGSPCGRAPQEWLRDRRRGPVQVVPYRCLGNALDACRARPGPATVAHPP